MRPARWCQWFHKQSDQSGTGWALLGAMLCADSGGDDQRCCGDLDVTLCHVPGSLIAYWLGELGFDSASRTECKMDRARADLCNFVGQTLDRSAPSAEQTQDVATVVTGPGAR